MLVPTQQKILSLLYRTISVNVVHGIVISSENHVNLLMTKHICVIKGLSPYRTVNILSHGYKNQTVNVL